MDNANKPAMNLRRRRSAPGTPRRRIHLSARLIGEADVYGLLSYRSTAEALESWAMIGRQIAPFIPSSGLSEIVEGRAFIRLYMVPDDDGVGRVYESGSVIRPDLRCRDMATISSNHDEISTTARILLLDVLAQPIESDLELSILLERGIPRRCVGHLMDRAGLGPAEVMRALHISEKTLKAWTDRRRPHMDQLLEPLHSAQLWTVASVFARAEIVFGCQPEALAWLRKPSLGLAGRRPADLLATSVGRIPY